MTDISADYAAIAPLAGRAEVEILHQLEIILSDASITLANPIEHRVKSLSSLLEKVERKGLTNKALTALPDLLGFRVVLLFRRDLEAVTQLISETFDIVESEDTSIRLSEVQFGYQSLHYVCKIPENWATLPSFRELREIRFEIQIRTASQHIWAAASHKLQYKQESAIPQPLRRSIHRVAALLETVDLEFERVLSEREIYENRSIVSADEGLNIVTLKRVLDEVWPENNRTSDREDYAILVQELLSVKVEKQESLKTLLLKYKSKTLAKDKARAKNVLLEGESQWPEEHINKAQLGAFYTHLGLTRVALEEEFGAQWHYKHGGKKTTTKRGKSK